MTNSDSCDLPTPDGHAADARQDLAELLERLRQTADHLAPDPRAPGDRPSRVPGRGDDLKLLSQALGELRRAFKVFAPYRSERKVTIFGSARTPHDAPEYAQAVELGRTMVEHGWYVVTGAATGIMEAGHRGAGRQRAMGLNIMLPFEQESNEIIRGDHKLVTMKYFFTRKLMFVKECDAVVCLPGGFGTLDEAFEVLTLLQTGKRELMPVVFLDAPGGRFWQDWLHYIRTNLLAGGMISPEDLSLFLVTDKLEETVAEVLGFYRVFNSMQYIATPPSKAACPKLVLRLQRPLTDAHLTAIGHQFADLLVDGEFQQLGKGGIPGEADEPHLADLSRLVFRFNRRSQGRLRQLIDAINGG